MGWFIVVVCTSSVNFIVGKSSEEVRAVNEAKHTSTAFLAVFELAFVDASNTFDIREIFQVYGFPSFIQEVVVVKDTLSVI